ncbi:hypothetical protein [Desulfamplus magnetovallimortis]|uniref:hypothetical protein n=1 Tax=Desulfamplus magnetovallimortis TaxID=1246637 RepID=UPI0009BBE01E|nr:hypothetical protein [Desulfamplus magnetovallimortis]
MEILYNCHDESLPQNNNENLQIVKTWNFHKKNISPFNPVLQNPVLLSLILFNIMQFNQKK